jgi:hypothetical protein
MNNKYNTNESEKLRILSLHEQAVGYPSLTNGGNIKINSTVPNIVSTATPEEKKLIDAANSWVESNMSTIPKTVPEITKFLTDKVTEKQLTPESLPYIKAAIQSKSNGTLVFPNEEVGGQPKVEVKPIQPGVKNERVAVLQKLLKTKYQKNIKDDGLWGPKTATALSEVLNTLPKDESKALQNNLSSETKPETKTETPNKPQNNQVTSGGGTTSTNFDPSKFS